MAIWNLPDFGENAPFPAASSPGHWKLSDGTLQNLGTSLKLSSKTSGDPHEPIRAIPDPWAQARTFAEALIAGRNGHSLHAEALGQWRGLLALFALRDLYAKDYDIVPRSIALAEEKLFDRVLAHLSPQVAIGDDVALWARPVIFMMSDDGRSERAIAMGNPACLVSPGRLTPDLSLESVPWYREGLRDPLKCGLPVTQLFLLSAWLRELHAALASTTGRVADSIRQLLLDYAGECDAATGRLALTANVGATLYAELPRPYSLLFATASLAPISDGSTTSQTRLRLEAGHDLGAFRGVILVDEALAKDDRFDTRRTLVWGTRTLGELLDSPAIFKDVAAEAASRGWLLATGDDLFTPRVARFDNGALVAGNPHGMEDVLAPVRPLALLLPGNIRDRLTARSARERVSFTLSLVLGDEGDAGRPLQLTRHYSTKPAPGESLLVEDENWNFYHASLWPDFRSPAWSSYFARITYSEQKRGHMVRPTLAMSGAMIAQDVAEQSTAQGAVTRICELNAGRPFAQSARWKNSQKPASLEYEDVQFSTLPFEAVLYVDAFGDRVDAQAGMALVNLPVIDVRGSGADVAVDFGTTNSVACFDNRQPIRFERRLLHPVTLRNPEELALMLSDARWQMTKFFPPELRHTPTPTVALQRLAFPSQATHHVFRNVIYFHSHQKHVANAPLDELKEFRRLKDDAKFNLKWSNDPEHAEAATDFLHQFALMIAAEAAAAGRDPRRLRWRFSIPDSLDGEMRLKFHDDLKRITASISTDIASSADILKPLYSEGLAAANFILQGDRFTRGSINIVFDIGGGTTDITIWDIGQIKWKGSFKLAGKDFFTSAISQNPEILTPIGLGLWHSLFEASASKDGPVRIEDVPDLAEMLFSGPALQHAIDTHWDSRLRVDTGKNLRIIALTFLAGLAWHMGRVVRQLVADGRLREDQLVNPAFALCGRGAGIFKKMHAERDADAESEVTRALSVFSISAAIDGLPRPQLFTTADAKLEVIRGMIGDEGRVDISAASGKADAETFTLGGVGLFLENEVTIDAAAKLERSAVIERVREVDLREIEAMLAALLEVANIQIDLKTDSKQGTLSAMSAEVIDAINSLLEKPDQRLALESPYVTALRSLIGIMASPSKERNGKLSMDFY
ncbi:hypothetical protein [Sphingomonas colocasiae]|uniref:Uncharacterized protein n=1 Tax=Sphingomonas colocasiae TaxID=1848973 RepID=A0ABS7PVY0_9SPHN|nr:hypothetical protein [Sphingomonas colocasiae]MBY8825522.1 hypothetical protein [Sphingomonas colocasiae]